MASVAVVGGGAVGLAYAAFLIDAGHDVRILLRRDYERVRQAGLTVHLTRTPEIAVTQRVGRLEIPPSRFVAAATTQQVLEHGPLDWVLVTLKTTALPDMPGLVGPLADASADAGIVAMCNGLGVEDRLAERVGPQRVFGAISTICSNRTPTGEVHHLGLGRLLLGHFLDDPVATGRLETFFNAAGIATLRPESLLLARWRKLAWNIPFNGLSVVVGEGGVSVDRIAQDTALRQLASDVIREVVQIANADMKARGMAGDVDAEQWLAAHWDHTDHMGAYLTSTCVDYRAGRPMEVESIFAEPLRRALRLGVPTPRLAMLTALLQDRAKHRSGGVSPQGAA